MPQQELPKTDGSSYKSKTKIQKNKGKEMWNLAPKSKVLCMPGARACFDNRARSEGEKMYTRQVSDLLSEERCLYSKRKAPNPETKESPPKLIVKNNNSEFLTQNYYY
jgi:hypothetical protein